MYEWVDIFDVSYLSSALDYEVECSQLLQQQIFYQRTIQNYSLTDLHKIGAAEGAMNIMCCDEQTGGVVDDLIQYFTVEDEVFLVTNAANIHRCCPTYSGESS